MHFCDKCDNMLYIKLMTEDSDNLVYYCRNCGNSEYPIDKDNICVSKTDIVISEKAYDHDINEYTKLDPTLPRTNNIKCPNQSCSSNNIISGLEEQDITGNSDENKVNEVIYLRYDDQNMKYIYMCTLCNKIWKTNDN
jgi:DNA-directed RNA polymerase subunit M/transcription elongation factor TFIIS